jgi:precorrin-3B synthase
MNQIAVKGWCPGALRPMESGDGLIVRLKLAGGILEVGLAAEMARWSLQWGNGRIDLSTRGNLQLRGISARNLPQLQDALAEHGLLDANPDGEAVRNVVSSPLAGLDPDAVLDVRPVAAALEKRLSTDAAQHALPAKFGFVVSDGGRFDLGNVSADIRFEAVHTEDGPAFVIGLDAAPRERFGPCPPECLPDLAATLGLVFLDHRNRLGSAIRRMRDLVSLVGAAPIAAEVGLSPAPLLRRSSAAVSGGPGSDQSGSLSGVQPPGKGSLLGVDPPGDGSPLGSRPSGSGAMLGVQPMGTGSFVGLGLAFGQMTADDLAQLTATAAAQGGKELRLTPWRAVLVPLPSVEAAGRLVDGVKTSSLIHDPDDPRLRVAACTGAPACPHATTNTRGDAARLAALIGHVPNAGIVVHVSGCAKGCAHPRSAPITLTGRDGRYDLICNGAPSDQAELHGLTLEAAAARLGRFLAERSLAQASEGQNG